jgi:hypothetical protein
MLEDKRWSLNYFQENGFALLSDSVDERTLNELVSAVEVARQSADSAISPGMRQLLRRCPAVRRLAESSKLLQIAKSLIGKDARPVKAILFDKTPASNWYVTWHQDLTIAVKDKFDVPGFGPWSLKEGVPHVQPPAAVLENMVSLRIHLDESSADNGAIKFIPGSHSKGIMDPSEISSWKTSREPICCAANRGDIIAMRPLILHSSSQSQLPNHRRVLHLEYAAGDLTGGLQWAEASGLDGVMLNN